MINTLVYLLFRLGTFCTQALIIQLNFAYDIAIEAFA